MSKKVSFRVKIINRGKMYFYASSFYRSQNVFGWSRPKYFEGALNAVKILGWLKKFGTAQNILGPVKGQGIKKNTGQ